MLIHLTLGTDLEINDTFKWIDVAISIDANNVIEMKDDGLYLPSSGLAEMGPIPNQGGDGLRVGFRGPFDYGNFPASGRITLNNVTHRTFIRKNGAFTNYNSLDCILPGDFIKEYNNDNELTDILVVTKVAEGASPSFLNNTVTEAVSLLPSS